MMGGAENYIQAYCIEKYGNENLENYDVMGSNQRYFELSLFMTVAC